MTLYKTYRSGNAYRPRIPYRSNVFQPTSLQNLQFLLNTAQGQQYTTEGAVNLVAASSQSLQAGNNSLFDPQTVPFGLMAWVKLTNKTASQTIASKHNGLTVVGSSYILSYNQSNDRFDLSTYSGSSTTITVDANAFGSPTAGVWYFIATWWDGTNINISVNNGTVNSTAFAGPINSVAQPFRIGANGNGGFLNGQAFQVSYFSQAITAGNITEAYNSGSGKPVNNWSASLTANLVSCYQFFNPSTLGKDYFGSNTLTPNNTPTYVAGPVTGTTLVSGDAVASILDQSSANNTASQTTGSNRYIFSTNQIGGQPGLGPIGTNSAYSLGSTISCPGVVTMYGVGKRNTSNVWDLFQGTGITNQFYGVFSDNNAYFGNTTTQISTAFNVINSFAFRLRRDSNNVVYVAATGFAEITIGTLSGTLTIANLFGIVTSTFGQTNSRFSLASLQLSDSIANGNDGPMRQYISQNFNLTIP